MNSIEKFNREFFESHPSADKISWFDWTGIQQITAELVAEITLCGNRYHVKIINKRIGKIAEKEFYFSEYLHTRVDMKSCYDGSFVAEYTNGRTSWRCAIPMVDEIEAMADKIMEYMDAWR